jgi:hypothetical protein
MVWAGSSEMVGRPNAVLDSFEAGEMGYRIDTVMVSFAAFVEPRQKDTRKWRLESREMA